MPSASSGVIGRTCATVPSRRTTSASHSTGAPVACAETRSIAPVSSLSSPPSMGSSCHVRAARPREMGVWSHGVHRGRPLPTHGPPLRPRPAGPPGGRRALPRQRGALPQRRLQPGLGLPRAHHAGRARRLLGGHDGARRGERPLARRHTGGSGARAVPVAQGRLPRPLRRARQGLDRPRRGALAGALLGRRHGHGVAAHPAHRHRRGARQPLLRGAAGAPRRRPRGLRDPRPAAASSGVVSIGYAVPGPRSPSLRRHRRNGREVAHWGRFGVAGEEA